MSKIQSAESSKVSDEHGGGVDLLRSIRITSVAKCNFMQYDRNEGKFGASFHIGLVKTHPLTWLRVLLTFHSRVNMNRQNYVGPDKT